MLDHLVLGVPDLDQGMAMVERRTGVRPAFGGRHPGRGTHNGLLALGGRQYLEIIALDPTQTETTGLLFPELSSLSEPAFVTWAVATDNIGGVASRASAAGYSPIGPLAGSRTRTDGSLLAWQTLRIDGCAIAPVPFFISWPAGAAHPSEDAPRGCRLTSMTVEHPDPQALVACLRALDAVETVVPGPRPRLSVRLETPNGQVELG